MGQKLKLIDVATVHPVLGSLLEMEFDYDLALAIHLFVEESRTHFKFYHAKRDELLAKYGKENKVGSGFFEIIPEHVAEFQENMAKLDSTEVSLPELVFPESALKGKQLKPVTVGALKRSGLLK